MSHDVHSRTRQATHSPDATGTRQADRTRRCSRRLLFDVHDPPDARLLWLRKRNFTRILPLRWDRCEPDSYTIFLSSGGGNDVRGSSFQGRNARTGLVGSRCRSLHTLRPSSLCWCLGLPCVCARYCLAMVSSITQLRPLAFCVRSGEVRGRRGRHGSPTSPPRKLQHIQALGDKNVI